VKLAQIGPKEPGFRQARRLSYSFRNPLTSEPGDLRVKLKHSTPRIFF